MLNSLHNIMCKLQLIQPLIIFYVSPLSEAIMHLLQIVAYVVEKKEWGTKGDKSSTVIQAL